jgi:hypothetical protein
MEGKIKDTLPKKLESKTDIEIDLDDYSIFFNNKSINEKNKLKSIKNTNYQKPMIQVNQAVQFPIYLNNPSYVYQLPAYNPINPIYPPQSFYMNNYVRPINPIMINVPNYHYNQSNMIPSNKKINITQKQSTVKIEEETKLSETLREKDDIPDYLLKPAGAKKFQKLIPLANEKEINYLFELIKNDFYVLMLNTFSNYFCQNFFPLISAKQRCQIWKSIEMNIYELSCNDLSTYCIQLLLNLAHEEAEQLKIIKYIKKYFLELAKDKQGICVLKIILLNFSEKVNSYIRDIVLENVYDLSKNKYAIGFLKFFLTQLYKNDSKLKSKVALLVASKIEEFLNDPYSHYLILFLIENWQENEYQIVTISILNKLPHVLFNKFSSRVLTDMLNKRIKTVHESIFNILLSMKEEILLDLIKNESVLQFLILFQSLQNEMDKLMLKEFIKKFYFNYQSKTNYNLINLYDKWLI